MLDETRKFAGIAIADQDSCTAVLHDVSEFVRCQSVVQRHKHDARGRQAENASK